MRGLEKYLYFPLNYRTWAAQDATSTPRTDDAATLELNSRIPRLAAKHINTTNRGTTRLKILTHATDNTLQRFL